MKLVTGLPRTGSTSVAKALEQMGYKVFHYCSITSEHQLDYDSNYDVVVTNDTSVFQKDWEKVLILTREEKSNQKSINGVLEQQNKIWDDSRKELDNFILTNFHHGKGIQMLNIFTSENPWLSLEFFMGEKESKNNTSFPHENFLDYSV